jgi:hypothetical protein
MYVTGSFHEACVSAKERGRPRGGDGGVENRGAGSVKLNSGNRKTLEAIFTNPVPSNIPWSDIERLFLALGGTVDNKRSGSRVAVFLRGRVAVFHEPHPNPDTDRGAVRNVRKFLSECGVI